MFIGKFAGFEFRVNQISIERDFETSAPRGDQFHVLDLLLESGQELARQTDGFRFVVSDRTVLELDIHVRLQIRLISTGLFYSILRIGGAEKRLEARGIIALKGFEAEF